MAQVLHPNTITATVNYHLTPEKGGSDVIYAGQVSMYRRKRDPRLVNIVDLRTCNETFTLDKQGFQLAQWPALTQDLDDDAIVKAEVYPEIVELLKQATGATRVHAFSHISRCAKYEDAMKSIEGADSKEFVTFRSTARFAHNDQSDVGAQRVFDNDCSAEDREKLRASRWAIINVWRPWNQVIRRDPLALCDARTLDESDLRPVELILPPQGTGTNYSEASKGGGFETQELLANPKHQWYYASELQPDEALLIKCFDSEKDGRARRSAHTAFASDKDCGPPRKSIEVRCLVFWEDSK